MKKISILLILFFSGFFCSAQMADIAPGSIYFVRGEGGWDLYIKRPKGVGSIILTESQRDPTYQVTAYSLRAVVKNQANASEKRLLNGKSIKSRDTSAYLIDSSAEKIGTIGEFYHFFLTDQVVFGYPWARNGTLEIKAGVRVNARLFEKKYGDYSGRFKDQWIVLNPEDLPLEKAEIKPKPAPEQAKAETTIVLLHSSDVDAEIAPSPKPSPAPSPAPAAENQSKLAAAAAKLALPPASKSATASYASLVVEKLPQFPFEKIKDAQPAGSVELKSNEERVLCQYLFEVDQDQNTKTAGFATYHEDALGRLARINKYGAQNQLVAVYLIEYAGGTAPIKVTQYDKDGQATAAK